MRSLVPILCGAVLAIPSAALGQHDQHEQHQMHEQHRMGAKAAIHEGAEAWAAAWNSGDAAAIAALYAEDAVVMAPGAEPAEGRAAVEAAMAGGLAASAGSQMKITPIEIMEGEGWAVEFGTFVQTGANGSHMDHGRYMAVWKNVDGTWMMYRDIWNSSM
jgi:uncharacterized protein (TIGR02246 family)